jgi:hypothetical protein
MAIVVTEEEYVQWRDSRVTRAFMFALKQDREWLKEMLLAGTEDDAGLRGRAAAVTQILNLTYEELMESIKETRDV